MQVGVRCLNTYSGAVVAVVVEEGGLVTCLNTGDTQDTLQSRVVMQVGLGRAVSRDLIIMLVNHKILSQENGTQYLKPGSKRQNNK